MSKIPQSFTRRTTKVTSEKSINPAKAGIQKADEIVDVTPWTPTFAGVTSIFNSLAVKFERYSIVRPPRRLPNPHIDLPAQGVEGISGGAFEDIGGLQGFVDGPVKF